MRLLGLNFPWKTCFVPTQIFSVNMSILTLNVSQKSIEVNYTFFILMKETTLPSGDLEKKQFYVTSLVTFQDETFGS